MLNAWERNISMMHRKMSAMRDKSISIKRKSWNNYRQMPYVRFISHRASFFSGSFLWLSQNSCDKLLARHWPISKTQTRPMVRCWCQAIIVSLKQLLSTLKWQQWIYWATWKENWRNERTTTRDKFWREKGPTGAEEGFRHTGKPHDKLNNIDCFVQSTNYWISRVL